MTLKKYIQRATALLTAIITTVSVVITNNTLQASACEYDSVSDFILIELTDEEQQALEIASLKYSSPVVVNTYNANNPYFEYDYTKDYFYLQLSNEEKQFYRNLYSTAVDCLYSNVDVDEYYTPIEYSVNISSDKIMAILYSFTYSNPQFFFFGAYFAFGQKNSQYNNFYFSVAENFSKSAKRKSMISQIESTTTEWMKEINQCSGWLEKEEKIYTLLCNNIVYGYGRDENGNIIPDENSSGVYHEYHQTIAGAIGEGVCVCNGYTMAFSYLCHLAGIDSIGIVGNGHAWNRVKLYGNWYEIDVTWMDQEWGIYLPYCNISTETLLSFDPIYHVPKKDVYCYFDLPDCLYDEVVIAEIFGDINGDWEFDMDDVIDLARSVLFTTPGSQNPYLSAADLDNSGEIDMDDVILLARKLIMG